MKESTKVSCPICGSRQLRISGLDYKDGCSNDTILTLRCEQSHRFTISLDIGIHRNENRRIMADLLSVWIENLNIERTWGRDD